MTAQLKVINASEKTASEIIEQASQPPQSPALPEEAQQPAIDFQAKPASTPLQALEASLFIANRPVKHTELTTILDTDHAKCLELLNQLKQEFDSRNSAIEVVITDEAAHLSVRSHHVASAAALSKKIDLTRKGQKILALVAKKGSLLQKDLHQYFRGEIYTYVTELREKGYIESKKAGNTRFLKPSRKFYEEFQLAESSGQ